ncbi:MAG: PepSY-associated TM helix domain-containing protein [Pirellulaceae bacterium]
MPESDVEPISTSHKTARKRKNKFAAFVRWLHIYVSLLGLAATLFFSVTGITLNHAGWFFGDSENAVTINGSLNASLVSDLRDPKSTTARLNVAEDLRAKHHLRGAVKEFAVDEFQSIVAFAGPGYSADVFVDHETGDYEITEIKQGFIAVINDLHKGRDTGPAWSLVIDISAIVLCLISLSGMMLVFWLRLRRNKGILTMIAGTVLIAILIWSVSP